MTTLTIPGVETFHPRTVWEPNGIDNWYGSWYLKTYGDLRRDSAFHRTPSSLYLPGYTHLAIHYTSAINIPDGDPGEILDGVDGIRALLARSHWDYLVNRTGGNYRRLADNRLFPGFPLGYSFAFDWLGGVWEINGFDYTPAATGGWNNRALAFLMLTDRADPGSALMWQSVRAVAREAVRRGARIVPENVWGHGEFYARTGTGTPTGCPGNALPLQIKAGLGDWTRDTPPPPEDEDMPARELIIKPPAATLYELKDGQRSEAPWFYVWNGDVRYALGADTKAGVKAEHENALRYGLLYEQVYNRPPVLVP